MIYDRVLLYKHYAIDNPLILKEHDFPPCIDGTPPSLFPSTAGGCLLALVLTVSVMDNLIITCAPKNNLKSKCVWHNCQVKVVLGGYRRCPDSHDLSECHHLYDLGRHI